MLKNIGGIEIIIIAGIILILFGGKKLPELAHGLAESIRTFRQGLKGEEETEV